MSSDFILLYSVTVFIASFLPGPSMLLALTHGMQYGAGRTVASALGNATVTLVQASVSIVGLGTVLVASETVFHLIKWAGAVYLIGIGISMLRSPRVPVPSERSALSSKSKSPVSLFFQGAVVTAGNPKAIIFFTAIFPQFIDPGVSYLFQSVILLAICVAIAFGCFMIYAIFGRAIVLLFYRASVGRIVNRIIGGTFIGAGIGLAVSNR